MNKKYVENSKSDRTASAEAWLNTLDTNKEYKAAVTNARKQMFYVEKVMPYNVKDFCGKYDTKVSIYNQDVAICTVAAVNHASEGDKVCVLDFASYTNPGGGFLTGALSQEESICRMSGLYPILQSRADIYEKRRLNLNNGLYGNDMFYIKDVPFMSRGRGKAVLADVIVAAAPNAKSYMKSAGAKKMELDHALKQRIGMIYTIPARMGANILLLGAFGCGVFGNEIDSVINYWMSCAELWPGLYKEIVHPVFDKAQYECFKKAYK